MFKSSQPLDIRLIKGSIFDAVSQLSSAMIESAEAIELVLPNVIKNICSVLDFSRGTLYTLNEDGSFLEAFADSDIPASDLSPIAIDVDEPIELIAEDIADILPEDHPEIAISSPLLLNEIPYGIICFYGENSDFEPEILEIVNTITEQLTLAVYSCYSEFTSSYGSDFDILSESPEEYTDAELVSESTPNMVDFAASLQILRGLEGGGDFHDFMHLPNNKLAITVGKSSGRGEKVENILEFIIPQIREELSNNRPIPEVLSILNEKIIEKSERGLLVSIALMILNTRTCKVSICRAGSVKMLRFKDAKLSLFEDGLGPHLGAFSGVKIKEIELQFAPNDSFAVMTDGINRISESSNFSLDQLTHNLSLCMKDNPDAQIADQIAALLKARHTSYTPELDITVLSLQRLRKPKSISQRLFAKK